jgi:hypothetical protein
MTPLASLKVRTKWNASAGTEEVTESIEYLKDSTAAVPFTFLSENRGNQANEIWKMCPRPYDAYARN